MGFEELPLQIYSKGAHLLMMVQQSTNPEEPSKHHIIGN